MSDIAKEWICGSVAIALFGLLVGVALAEAMQ